MGRCRIVYTEYCSRFGVLFVYDIIPCPFLRSDPKPIPKFKEIVSDKVNAARFAR